MEVEVREDGAIRTDSAAILVNITPAYPVTEQPELIVRAEEVLLVVLVLMIWVAAIALFFNRWGQIRTLEPYQPKFQQSHHRTSCPLAPLSSPHITPQRMSFSKYNVNCFSDTYTGLPSPVSIRRPRLNSVFVGSSTMAILNTPPRRVKSAIDIQHLIVNEKSKRASLVGFNSMIPITSIHHRSERRPSISIERPFYGGRRRPSAAIDRPMLSHYHYGGGRNRRTSCFVDRRHKNFISFDQSERKLSITIEKVPSNGDQQKPNQSSVSFDTTTPSISFDSPTVIVEHAEINHCRSQRNSSHSTPKMSRSFEQPTPKMIVPRMSTSLDVQTGGGEKTSSDSSSQRTSLNAVESQSIEPNSSVSTIDHDGSSSVVVSFEDAAPLLETLKSSDV
ncbi:uncharacterized protein [Onthophagus taurus]|uniref:uncharacterized protein isoform X2 n=1 Tax=Onthophagus taurus TaxID=166361 RepID=UPI000C208952|nr:uncharacterized protein LOC111428781 isoform X2 [Onthophagus taurus]XP_022920238.1 uncharacterized protein LOC111428781 isoform X2 [Onthophagus taurus]XP_022920239.1 uncharacterized protein LOC111428781 isoform X2 [Onthophagus taurus]XP_022920240.1 uncharacterized protein LOC111428781 isoform X2 [Onthophagus taurus]